MPLATDRVETRLPDHKPALTEAQARAEAARCLFCHDAPCVAACPTGIDIPMFIRQIHASNLVGAARTIFEANALGHSCARVCPVEVLCVGACVYNAKGEPPIMIGRLQRFATDTVVEEGIEIFEPGEPTGRSVACVGGGPASIACAHELVRLGHRAVILEKRPYRGGLNTDGVAPYKMKADASLAEVEWLTAIGIEWRDGVEVGRDVTWQALEAEFDAGVSTVQWVINAYALIFGVLIVTGGRLADLLGLLLVPGARWHTIPACCQSAASPSCSRTGSAIWQWPPRPCAL